LERADKVIATSPNYVDFSQVDFKKMQQQMGTIQSEMLKLASMMIPQQAENDSSNTNQS
jgi:hypothetical protein